MEADIIAVERIGSGLPLSAVIGSKKVMDLPSVGNMSSTHSANPLVCAAGLATLEFLENENLINKSKEQGKLLHKRLNEIRKDFLIFFIELKEEV